VLADPTVANVATEASEPGSLVEVLRRRSMSGFLYLHELGEAVASPVAVRIFVEEAPSSPAPPREEWDAEAVWLIVPSGRLEVRTAADFAVGAPSSDAPSLHLPPGDYRLDAWETGRPHAFGDATGAVPEREIMVVLTRVLDELGDE
jgi:hypothetical protein